MWRSSYGWSCDYIPAQEVLLAALESGFNTAVFNNAQAAATSKQYASFKRLVIGDLLDHAQLSMQVISDADTNNEVRWLKKSFYIIKLPAELVTW
jgi:hypothetical protein